MAINTEALYLQLGQLVASMPDLLAGPITNDTNQWLGRASALVEAVGNLADITAFNVSAQNLNGALRASNAQTIAVIVQRALAKAEMNAPVSVKGAFVAAGSAFDAFAAVGKVLSQAKSGVLIIDPYADEKALTDFAVQAQEGIAIRILADEANQKPTLKPAKERWIQQFGGVRPLEVRLAAARTLHDRLIFLDETDVWSLTQSLNAFAARSPATIIRLDGEISAMKIAAYEPIWQTATSL